LPASPPPPELEPLLEEPLLDPEELPLLDPDELPLLLDPDELPLLDPDELETPDELPPSVVCAEPPPEDEPQAIAPSPIAIKP
jgi:hypothetical protein